MKPKLERYGNSVGRVFYGMHFYPGVCRYDEPGKEELTVLLKEDTLRKMDPTFPGCPLFVRHVNEVPDEIEQVKEDADGWIIESFFNQKDGKHWTKFIAVTDKAFDAIRRGFKLSNCYVATEYGPGGKWNNIEYEKEVLDGEFEHMALVPDPRYEESIVLTPEQFKEYNESQNIELLKFANSLNKEGENSMKLNLFKRQKVENSTDLEGMMVELPKSKKEMTLQNAITIADKYTNLSGYADGAHIVKVGENEMSVNDLVKAHMKACNEIEEMKKSRDDEGEDMEELENSESEEETEEEGEDDVGDRGGDRSMHNDDDGMDESMENSEDEEDEKPPKSKKLNEKKKNSKGGGEKRYTLEEATRLVNRKKAARLANARERMMNSEEDDMVPTLSFGHDQVERGKQLYGSGN